MVYDRTQLRRPLPGLSTAWSAGALLYRGLGRLDASFGATSWGEALDFIAKHDAIEEIQFWGHGKWGSVVVDREHLDAAALSPGHVLYPKIEAVRAKLAPDALVWLRTCEAFGAKVGHDYAMKLADTLGARVAGHTFVIGALQSGLRGLRPGHRPDWALGEGIAEGTPENPVRAYDSSMREVRTITCLQGRVPADWFA